MYKDKGTGILTDGQGDDFKSPGKIQPRLLGFPWESLLIIGLFALLGRWASSSDWQSSNDFHSCMEMVGSLLALVGGTVCLLYFFGLKNRYYLVVGLGFFLAGAEDLIHGSISFHRLVQDTSLDVTRLIPTNYISGRFALALTLILAPLIEDKIKRIGSLRKEAMVFVSCVLLLGVGVTTLMIVLPVQKLSIPGFQFSRPMDLFSMLAFLVALVLVGQRYRKKRDIFSRMIIASVVINLGGQLLMSFSKQLNDSFFDLAHLANVLSYLPPALGVAISGLQEMIRARLEIVERKKAQKKLRESKSNLEKSVNELFRTRSRQGLIIESIDEGLVVVDPRWMVITANVKAASILGLKKGIPAGMQFDELFAHSEDPEKALAQAMSDEPTHRFEIEIVQDKTITVDLRYSLLEDTLKGDQLGRVFVLRDITREKEIDRMKDRFVASVSHELRTPLTSIKGFTATILRDPDMTPETRNRFLGIVDEESTRLAHLIDNLLEISHLTAQQTDLEKVGFSLKEVLLKVAANFGPMAIDQKIELSTDFSSDLPEVTGDPEKIQAVFINLVGNALKFTPDGGNVGIHVFQQHDQAVIRVTDSGCGIPEADRDKVFDRFFRVYRPGSQIPGTGLGLSIAKEIIDGHKGSIDVTEATGGGTCFTVSLPLSGIPEVEEAITVTPVVKK